MIKTKHVQYALGLGLMVLATRLLSQQSHLGYLVGLLGLASIVLNYRAKTPKPVEETDPTEE
jgi:hypothetical protein